MLGSVTERRVGGVVAAGVLAFASVLPWESRVTIAGAHDVSGLHLGGAITLPLALVAVLFILAGGGRHAALLGAGAAVVAGWDLVRLVTARHDIIDANSSPQIGVGLAVVAALWLVWAGRPREEAAR